jgi:hypothetical protein
MPEERLRLRDIPSWIARLRDLPFEERLERASAAFLGLPYRDDSVGEGRTGAFDRRPAFRLDSFDCQTYVETSLALAAARSGREFRATVLALRYREGKVDFSVRNHLTRPQWILNNIAAGFIRNVTAAVAGDEPTQRETRQFDVANWFGNLGPTRLHGFQEDRAAHEERLSRLRRAWTGPRSIPFETPLLPLTAIVRTGEPFLGGTKVSGLQVNAPLLERLPKGAILMLSSRTWVHMALAVRHRGEWMVRHASREQARLLENPLVPLFFNMGRSGETCSLMILEPLLVSLPGNETPLDLILPRSSPLSDSPRSVVPFRKFV